MLGGKRSIYGSIRTPSIRHQPLQHFVAGLGLGTARPRSSYKKSIATANRRYGSSLPEASQVHGIDSGVQDVVTSSSAPSTSVLLSALFGLPLALWIYKVRQQNGTHHLALKTIR
jgi:hypothetical protein